MSSVTEDPGVSSILLFSGSGINFPRPLYCTVSQTKKVILACLDPNPRPPLYSDPLGHLNLDLYSLTGESECYPDLGYETRSSPLRS
jgi:hypothetical protein